MNDLTNSCDDDFLKCNEFEILGKFQALDWKTDQKCSLYLICFEYDTLTETYLDSSNSHFRHLHRYYKIRREITKYKRLDFEHHAENCRINQSYFLVITSVEEGRNPCSVYAIYQIMQKIDFINKDQNHKNYFQLMVQKNLNRMSIKNIWDKSIAEDNSHIYILRLRGRDFYSKSSTINRYANLSIEVRYEYNLLLKSLYYISAIMFRNNQAKTTQKEISSNDCNYSYGKKETRSGITIKLQKVQDTSSLTSYIIEDCSVKLFDEHHEQTKRNKFKKKQPNVKNDELHDELQTVSYKEMDDCDIKNIHSSVIESEDIDNFYFILPNEKKILTDYMFVLMTQVKRGRLTSNDRDNARRNNPVLVEGYLGLRCRNCGGKERGHYFPSTCKNLQACPSMILKHLMSCEKCPQKIKELLRLTKSNHKLQGPRKGSGAQIGFFNLLWKRIHDRGFTGGDVDARKEVLSILYNLCHQYLSDQNDTTSIISESFIKVQEVENINHDVNAEITSEEDQNCNNPITSNMINIKNTEVSLPSKQVDKVDTIIESSDGKNMKGIQYLPSVEKHSIFPDSSAFQRVKPINSIFESHSLNVTLDMLDTFAGEILNSAPYTYRAGKRKLKTCCSGLDVERDEASLNTIKEMVESDTDYMEMIEILARMTESDDNIVTI